MRGSSDRLRHKLESNLNMLMDEYKFTSGQCENYFTRIYSCMNFTFVFYGVILSVFRNFLGQASDTLTALLIFFYFLPILTYILGLFYAYNAMEICKYRFFLIQLERDIIELNRRLGFPKPFHGETVFAKKTSGGFMLPGGTMLVFYLGVSPCFMAYATFFTDFERLPKAIFITVIVYVIPWLFLLTHIVFMSYLIRQMAKFRKLCHAAAEKETLPYAEEFPIR